MKKNTWMWIVVIVIAWYIAWYSYKNRNKKVIGESCGECVNRLLENRGYNPTTALVECRSENCIE